MKTTIFSRLQKVGEKETSRTALAQFELVLSPMPLWRKKWLIGLTIKEVCDVNCHEHHRLLEFDVIEMKTKIRLSMMDVCSIKSTETTSGQCL
jgi:hypothetical protein